MKSIIDRSQRFLERPLGLGPRIVLFAGALVLIPAHFPSFGNERGPEAGWIPFAFGGLALLFLRAALQGKVRDLVDVSVLAVYFAIFLVWTGTRAADVWGIATLFVPTSVAFLMAHAQAHRDEVAETRLAE